MAIEILKRNGVNAVWGAFNLFPMATALRSKEKRIAELEAKTAVMEHGEAGYLYDLYVKDERIKELESRIARMDEIARNDGYAEGAVGFSQVTVKPTAPSTRCRLIRQERIVSVAHRIVNAFVRFAKRGVRGKACPNCGSTNTSSPDGDLRHCFDCGKTWR